MFPDRRVPPRISPGQRRPGTPRRPMQQPQRRQRRAGGNMAAPRQMAIGRGRMAGPRGRRAGAVQEQQTQKKKSSIVEQLKKEDGQWDLDKIMAVSNQLQKMYGQVSPLITRFIK